MIKEIITLPEVKLVGLSAVTSNFAEMNGATAKIGPTFHRFFLEQLPSKINSEGTAGRIFSVYTQYESDFTGSYTYFLGKEVSSFNGQDKNLETITIPEQKYAKFTTEKGPMPAIVLQAWQNIWMMTASDLGADRAYIADFEIYDERSSNPSEAVVDIYVGLKS